MQKYQVWKRSRGIRFLHETLNKVFELITVYTTRINKKHQKELQISIIFFETIIYYLGWRYFYRFNWFFRNTNKNGASRETF